MCHGIRTMNNIIIFPRLCYYFAVTLITKNFGQFKFRTKGCPKFELSEIFRSEIYKCPKFLMGLIFFFFQFQSFDGTDNSMQDSGDVRGGQGGSKNKIENVLSYWT